MKKIAVLTGGSSAPGMNAVLRAVVRRGIFSGLDIYAIQGGFKGLVNGDINEMSLGCVGDIIHRGGTILQYSHFDDFKKEEIQQKAIEQLVKSEIDGLVVLGANGSMKAAEKLNSLGFPTIGIPVTINNDVVGTEYTIGFDTAVNTVVHAIDKIRDTASSHIRNYVIEVAGRTGDIALWSGICSGAESIIIPETSHDVEDIIDRIQQGYERGKNHSIIVVAEGLEKGNGKELGKVIQETTNLETKVTILGHLQRGGSPSAYDRMMSSQMGAKAVDLLVGGEKGVLVGLKNARLVCTSFEEARKNESEFNLNTYQLAKSLSI